jgi:hypothetical protein
VSHSGDAAYPHLLICLFVPTLSPRFLLVFFVGHKYPTRSLKPLMETFCRSLTYRPRLRLLVWEVALQTPARLGSRLSLRWSRDMCSSDSLIITAVKTRVPKLATKTGKGQKSSSNKSREGRPNNTVGPQLSQLFNLNPHTRVFREGGTIRKPRLRSSGRIPHWPPDTRIRNDFHKEGQTSQWDILPPSALLDEKEEYKSELLPPARPPKTRGHNERTL